MKKHSKTIVVVLILLLIAGMALFPFIRGKYILKKEKEDSRAMSAIPRNMPLNINISVLAYENMNDILKTKGILIPDEEVDLSFETSGKITHIYFKEGNSVSKGDLLAKVNDNHLQAELRKLKAQLPLAEERVFRQKSLLEKDAVSQEAYEAVSTELDKLKADIDLVIARIEQTELRAPFHGVIGLRFVSEGAYASPSVVVAKLTKINPLKIEFSVNEKQANEIKEGTLINFTLENDLNVYQAKVYAVESSLDEKTLSLKVRALYANTSGKLKPGHSTNIEINLREIKNTIVIPSLSIVAEMGRDIVYLYKQGKAEQVVVTKGMRTASSVQILHGLDEGDTLITSGVMQLRNGMDVVINN
ncbi:MAG: efflux RND transporter periplasmic adaptor subunit [Bacteroidales bacterium]|jgi:membrane fusion protein (multidrug efflux system)|nr:efflux RND transporter periplasmic adaptor subunit [Bacteroidales bacterium]